MDFQIKDASVKERVEIRNQMRNLDSFLDYSFGEDKKLALIQEMVHGHAIESLKEMDSQYITWKSYPALWWSGSLNLRKITHFITENMADWTQLLQQDSSKLVKLELQCARLEKAVAKYNSKIKLDKSKAELISFVNPFRKTIKINVSYPAIIGQDRRTAVVRDVFYDRLTTAKELAASVKEAMDKPVLVRVISAGEKGDLDLISFSVVPGHLFKTVVQDLEVAFDPADGVDREDVQAVSAVYDDHDVRVLAGLIFKAGEGQSLSQVYEQGFLAGRIAGFTDALAKMKSVFGGS